MIENGSERLQLFAYTRVSTRMQVEGGNLENQRRSIKKVVQREYKLNPILAIQFIFKGKVLPDNLKFTKIAIHPKKDVITVMATQAGGDDQISDKN